MKNKIWILIILILFGILCFQWKCKDAKTEQDIVTVTKSDTLWQMSKPDTVYVYTHNTLSSTKTVPPPELAADSNCGVLRQQYEDIVGKYCTINQYIDTVKNDSSIVIVKNAVQYNKLQPSSFVFINKYPVITNTTERTILQPKVGKVFIGGGLETNKQVDMLKANIGLMYVSKKENGLLLTIGADNKNNMYGGINYYKKISLKRK